MFVDLHSHILHGLDDGAKTIDESVAMLEIASRCGTRDIVATPHASAQFAFEPELVERRIADLHQVAETISVRIHPGCDFHLQVDNIEDAVAHPRKYTINHGVYLLVEFSDLGVLHGAEQILKRLLDGGMAPVITHPERHAHLQQRFDDLAAWVECGCYVQVTAGSFTGLFGKRAMAAAEEMVKRGLVHFVASDAHDRTSRTPNLRDAYERLVERWGEERIRPLFVDNPGAALASEPLEFEPVSISTKARKWYRFWA